ncbi:Acetyl xylan esterase (AXE1) [Maioricimonas rarisocia]|uniref:Acetyl xylan esterase (AXE1) n=1 Tax=Maioricimonas rarisocia TaxID=2528026 RepID=A0A517Z6M0_9PLAN|nr:acetylxylan esterase [Maioricimonas rarisocia]QDU38133.1 Acetyl xylan esterase (AXE1) [Maioricimonas rarisocia]
MLNRRTVFTALVMVVGLSAFCAADEPQGRVFPPGSRPDDARLKPLRTLRDAYHPWSPPSTRAAWEEEATRIRQQLLVSNGLWPMPEKTPLEPVIRQIADRGDYTVHAVHFASRPGHYVTGNLYRPKDRDGRLPAVLSPHGHWQNGRFYDAGKSGASEQLAIGAEEYMSGARFPLQARMVQLARMGCVVFHYDMVGYAESTAIPHREGFNDAESALWLVNKMGLQTWNSVRALDFLAGLPDVDPERIAVTGASGGGTQTFVLCAIDPRPAVAFPAVMVSTAMQGGCVCENASYLRVGINNVAFAALFAPKPLGLSGADDWTIDIETKGLPELRQVWSMYGAAENVHARALPRFKHNYNQVSREMMYAWLAEHLDLDVQEPVRESDFWPLSPEELAVFDEQHPRPEDEKGPAELREDLIAEARAIYQDLLPESAEGIDEYRRVVGAALRVMLDGDAPAAEDVVREETATTDHGRYRLVRGYCGTRSGGEQIPTVAWVPTEEGNGSVVAWFDGAGKAHLFADDGGPSERARQLLDAGFAVVSADLFLTGEYVEVEETASRMKVDSGYPGYTFGYNRPLLTQRVRDIVVVTAAIRSHEEVERTHLVGTGNAGPMVLLARSLLGERVERTLADVGAFTFEAIEDPADPMFLPGALRYGDLGGLAATAFPAALDLFVAEADQPGLQSLRTVYQAGGQSLSVVEERLTVRTVLQHLQQAEPTPR